MGVGIISMVVNSIANKVILPVLINEADNFFCQLERRWLFTPMNPAYAYMAPGP